MIGYGDIGKACGRLAHAFQMRVVAFRRRPTMSEADRADGVLARVYGPDEFTDMISACDYILMATPATPHTHKLFSAAAVAAMQPHAVFVNVGRGMCVDEEALIAALQTGAPRAKPDESCGRREGAHAGVAAAWRAQRFCRCVVRVSRMHALSFRREDVLLTSVRAVLMVL